MKKKENLKVTSQTIASSKAAQTQLKTSLRNHIDLSAIADNKANIMLSINAIVITVGLPLIAQRLGANSYYIYPLIALALSSILSMAYATLATRPIKMSGKTNLDLIKEKKTNLFFFGNFYKMDFNEYETGIKEVVQKNDILENSITRDLFFLGKSLGTKFDYLRSCYNIFMIGMMLTVVLFVVASILGHS
ncbi:MAG: Pycsar system effector family protein [Saprospiraceae bacterium]